MFFYYISLILATQPSDSAPNKTSTVKNSNLHLSSESKSYAEVLSKPIFFARFFRLSASVGFFEDSNKETTTPTDLLRLKRFRNYFHDKKLEVYMRSLKDISGKNGNSDPYLRQCYYIIILCIAVFSEQDIVFSFLAIMALFDCEIPKTRLVPSLTSDKLYNITLLPVL